MGLILILALIVTVFYRGRIGSFLNDVGIFVRTAFLFWLIAILVVGILLYFAVFAILPHSR